MAQALPNQPDGHGLVAFLFAPPNIVEIWSGVIPSSWCRVELLSHLTLAKVCWLVDASTAANAQTLAKPFTRCVLVCFPAMMRAQTALRTTHLLCSSPNQASLRPLARGGGMLTWSVVFQDPRLDSPIASMASSQCAGRLPPLSTARNPAASH